MGSVPSITKNDQDPLVDEKDDGPSGYGSLDDNAQATEEQQPPPAAEVSSQMSTPKISHLHLMKQQQAAAEHRQAILKQQLQKAKQLGRHRSADDDGGDWRRRLSSQRKPNTYEDESDDNDDESLVSFADDDNDSFRRYRRHSHEGRLSRIRSSFLSSRESIRESLRSVVDQTFVLPGKPCDVRENEGTATMANEIFNLVKNLVGAGALGLPSGVAAFGNHPAALIPAMAVIMIMGAIFAYYFTMMGRICRITGTASYSEAWAEVMGEEGVGLVALFVTLMASLGNLAYSMILADTTKSLLAAAGIEWTRTQCLWFVTIVALWPLCNVKKLSVLAPFSFLGMAGILFTIGSMMWRYFDGSYANGGRYVDDLSDEMTPSFGSVGATGAFSANVFIIICMAYQAFFAHYNAPRYYVELKDNTMQRFGTVVVSSFAISGMLYIIMTSFGFLTFGQNSLGMILNNYSVNDELATVCRVCIAVSLVFTYPLPFIGTRDGILALLDVPLEKQTSNNLNMLTILLLATITLLAMHFTDLGTVNAVGGALFGTAVVFVFPSLMFRDSMHSLGFHATTKQLRETHYVMWLMWIGIAFGVLGVVTAVVG